MDKLFDFSLTPRISCTEELYYRKSKDGVSFNTYFHVIPVRKYKEYTTVQKIRFSAVSDIYTEFGLLRSGTEISLNEVPGEAELLYIATKEMPEKLIAEAEGDHKNVYPAIIICTYHRNEQVISNIDYILEHFNDIPLDIILVDNASEIPQDRWNSQRVKVLHNPNTGGSGGFSRGMQYAAEQGKYTHILLMDDDVTVEYVALQRLFSFLSFLKEEYSDLSISGSMLYTDEPMIQFECGGLFEENGLQTGYGYRFDLTDFQRLKENEQTKRINYGGWWMFCMPIRYAVEGNLPAPFFIKYDDVEYALRCKMKIITLNGVGVWHDNFGIKYNSVQEYFNTRNHLFLMKKINPQFDERSAYKKARHLLLEKLCRQQYKMAEAVILAYEDYLKGESYLAQIDYASKLSELKGLNYEMLTMEEIRDKYDICFDEVLYQKSFGKRFHRYMQPLLYGHLIPKIFCRKLTVTDVLADRKECYFRTSRAIHYCWNVQKGYVTSKDLKIFIKYMKKLKRIAIGRNGQ